MPTAKTRGSRELLDPPFEEIRDGGPTAVRMIADAYTARLRGTGREEHVGTIAARGVVVDQGPGEFLRKRP